MKGEPPAPYPYAALLQAARDRMAFFKQEGVAVLLRDSNKPHALLNMTESAERNSMSARYRPHLLPAKAIGMIFRMLKHGPVNVEIEMTNSFSEKPVEVYNTVAEIRGSEKPDEVVMIGGPSGFLGSGDGFDG